MDDRRWMTTTEVIPMPRQAQPPPEPGVLRDPGPNPPLIERSQLLSITAVVVVLLLLVVTLAALMPRSPESGTAHPDFGPGAPDGDQALIDLERVDDGEARQLLRESGFAAPGTVKRSWTWTDRNGFNLATTSVVERGRASDPATVTLNVTHLANLDGRPRQLRSLADPINCDHRGRLRAGFTDGSFRVSDLDGDGIAEVTVGWWFTCDDGQPDATTVKLLLLSDGKKFVRRGTGPVVAGGDGASTKEVGTASLEASGAAESTEQHVLAPLSSFSAEPREARWPRAFWDRSQQLLTSLHSTP